MQVIIICQRQHCLQRGYSDQRQHWLSIVNPWQLNLSSDTPACGGLRSSWNSSRLYLGLNSRRFNVTNCDIGGAELRSGRKGATPQRFVDFVKGHDRPSVVFIHTEENGLRHSESPADVVRHIWNRMSDVTKPDRIVCRSVASVSGYAWAPRTRCGNQPVSAALCGDVLVRFTAGDIVNCSLHKIRFLTIAVFTTICTVVTDTGIAFGRLSSRACRTCVADRNLPIQLLRCIYIYHALICLELVRWQFQFVTGCLCKCVVEQVKQW